MGVERGVVRHDPEEPAVVVVFEDQGTITCFEVIGGALVPHFDQCDRTVLGPDLGLAEALVHPAGADHAHPADEVPAARNLALPGQTTPHALEDSSRRLVVLPSPGHGRRGTAHRTRRADITL